MAPPPRRTVQLEACVLSARGLVSSKGEEEPVSSSASVSLLGNAAVESELISPKGPKEVAEGEEPEAPDLGREPTYDLSTLHTFKAEDANCALLLSTPLSVSVYEGAEKTLLGSATLSLEPLFHGAGIGEQWLPLVGAEGEAVAGEVCVCVKAAMAVMSEEEWEESAMLTLSVDSLHSLPPSFGLAELSSEEEHTFTYTATATFLGEELVYTGKARPPPPAAEDGGEAEAAAAPAAEGEEAAAPAVEAPAAAPLDPQSAAEAASGAIEFEGPTTTRFLGPEATRALRDQLKAGSAPLAIKLTREVKTPETVFDSNAPKYAALCDACPSGLLAVDTLTASERAKITPAPLPEEPPAPPEGKGAPTPTDVEEEEEGAPHPYEASGTYFKVTVTLTRPLEPKPLPPPPPLPSVGEMIPKRILPHLAPKTAVEEFDAQIASIVDSMVGEWTSLFPDLDPNVMSDDASKDDRRRALLYALNTSGKYWMFKERLKRSVVRLTKDTMSRPGAEPLDAKSMELFYNDLYVKLTQRLHQALNGIFFPPTEAPKAPNLPDQPEGAAAAAVLGALAKEAETVGDLAMAATYHKERVASSPHAAAAWYEYALFLMRTNDAPLAEECTREAIALTPQSAECLFAHGCVLAARGNLEQAEIFLKASLEQTPGSTDSWVAMVLLYDLMGRSNDMRTSAKQARQLHGQDSLNGAYLSLATKLLPLNCAVLIERALQLEEELQGGESGALLLCRGEMQLYKEGGVATAAATLEAGLEMARKSSSGFCLLGKAKLLLGDAAAARAAFEKSLDLSPQPYPLAALLLLGKLCLDDGDNARAKELFLFACRQNPCCTAWLGAGVACLRLGEASQAEEALAEANVLNNRHPDVWGQLALLSLQAQRFDEAMQALGQAYKLGLSEPSLLVALSAALFAVGKWQDAEGAARRAMLSGASAAGHRALGDALMEQQRYDESLAEFKAALSSSPDAEAEKHCRSQASHILHFHLNRPHEAASL